MPGSTDQTSSAPATRGGALSRPPGTRAGRPRAAPATLLKASLVRLHRYAGLGAALFLVAAGISGAIIAAEGTLLPPSFVAEHHRVEPRSRREPLEPVLAELQERYGEAPGRLTVRGDPAFPDEYRISGREAVYVDPYAGEIIARTAPARRNERVHT